MRSRGTSVHGDGVDSPLRVFVLVLLLVFVAELVIMLALPLLPRSMSGQVTEGVLDAGLLTLGLAPGVWYLVVRPLRTTLRERGRLLLRTLDVQEDERRRLGRDLHDDIGQRLTALLLGLRTIQRTELSPDAKVQALTLSRLTGETLEQVRRLARGLRPAVLEDFGLSTAVERLCEDLRAALRIPIECSCTFPVDRRFDAATETAAYRILQEALTNVARHARASNVVVALDLHGEHGVRLTVSDNGVGFEHGVIRGPNSFGLRGLVERARLLGGWVEITTSRATGSRIEAYLPGKALA